MTYFITLVITCIVLMTSLFAYEDRRANKEKEREERDQLKSLRIALRNWQL